MSKLLNKAVLSSAALLFGLSALAQPKPDKVLKLYPQGQGVDMGIVENGVQITLGPGESNGLTGAEKVPENGNIGNINDDARIEIYLPKGKATGQMIVNVPGGAYAIVASKNEGSYAADWLLSKGIAVCNVLYRLPNHHHTVPLRDVQNAFRYCRAHAEEWGINQIGIMGYSAGGHLASTACTHYVDQITRPDFAVLIYPVISLDETITHKGTRVNLTNNDPLLVEHYSSEKHVDGNTPQTFIALSSYDDVVPVENSLRYYRALADNNVKCEMYIMPYGGHGWGFTTDKFGKDNLKEYRTVFFDALEHYLNNISLAK